MAKLRLDQITEADLQEYCATASDFAFEQRVFAELRRLKFDAQHGGTYTDPVTSKPREFDIRAGRDLEVSRYYDRFWFRMAISVECKNIGKHCPLVIGTVPRRECDAFHEFMVVSKNSNDGNPESWNAVRVSQKLYRTGEAVGKDCVQVGRLASNNELSGSDQTVYEKWSQALSSSHDLAFNATSHRPDGYTKGYTHLTSVLPLVVVPDGTLWEIPFDGSGDQKAPPQVVSSCPYFVGHSILRGGERIMELSHLHFCTISGLESFFEALTANPTDELFPEWQLRTL